MLQTSEHRRTDEWKDGKTDRQMDRQTDHYMVPAERDPNKNILIMENNVILIQRVRIIGTLWKCHQVVGGC